MRSGVLRGGGGKGTCPLSLLKLLKGECSVFQKNMLL